MANKTFSSMIKQQFGLTCSHSSGRGQRRFYVMKDGKELNGNSTEAKDIVDFLVNHKDVTTYTMVRETTKAWLIVITGTTSSCIIHQNNGESGLLIIKVNQTQSEDQLVEYFKTVGTVTKLVK